MKRSPRLTQTQKEALATHIKESGDAKEIRRCQAILLTDVHTGTEAIKALTAYKERTVLGLRKRYLKDGLKGIENKRRGKPKLLLSKDQRTEIVEFLTKTSPKDHELEQDFWTTSSLAYIINKKYGVTYKTKKPYYLLFEESKMSFHKPGKVYERRDEGRVDTWKKEVKPKIEESFNDPNTIILCEDEMVLSSTTTFQKIWLKKGEYPKIEVSNTKKNKSIYGFLAIKTGKCHAFVKDWQNMFITVEVLKEIRKIYQTQKIVLIWDGAGWHKGAEVVKFIETDKKIEILHFPPYSPEENPQEHVWKAGRAAVTHNQYIPDINKAADEFVLHLNQTVFIYKFLDLTAQS